MKLLIQAAMVFFGTLMMAGLVALREGPAGRASAVDAVAPIVVAAQQLFESAWTRGAGASLVER